MTKLTSHNEHEHPIQTGIVKHRRRRVSSMTSSRFSLLVILTCCNLYHSAVVASGLKIAFVGDTGVEDVEYGGYGHLTMNMIEDENVDLVVDVGDFDYWGNSGPDLWRDFLGGYNFDFLGASGNAEVQDPIYGSSEIWAKHQRNLWDHYKTRIVDRNRGACRGYYDREEPGSVEEYGERYSCFYGPNNEHHIIFLGWFQGSNQSNVEEARHEIARSARFIDREFSSSRKKVQNTKWRYCVQHMTTSKLSGGGGPDHDNMRNSAITDTCRKHGALIISGHHHIYSRTKLLSSVGGRNGREDVVTNSNQREIRPGRTMSLTVGMGGYGGRCNGKFANAPWMEQCITGGQFRGAVIAEFDDDDPRRAIFRYKNSMADDEILDEWRLFSRLAAPPTPPPTSPPTRRPRLGECKGDCDNDDDCQSGLYCYQRDPYEPIPGCDGVGESDGSRTDYCTYDGTRIDES